MARYFFDFIDKDRTITDVEGQEFANAEEAKAHALHVSIEIARSAPNQCHEKNWISVRSEAGLEIFRVPLSSRVG